MIRYWGRAEFAREGGGEGDDAVGVLVANLGTPDAPTARALRPYLKQFLSDPRIIELPKWKWQPILRLFVLTRRPKKSAELYRKVWTPEGSPLLKITEKQAAGIGEILRKELPVPVHVEVGMRLGTPSVGDAMRRLAEKGCRRILVLPLYPQYSGTTTGSVFDAVADELKTWRLVPELRTVNGYHDEPAYIDALAASIREAWAKHGEPAKLLFSFHGIPLRYSEGGDPYAAQCRATARLTAEALGLPDDRWETVFQSRFGREEWLQPYTDETVKRLGREKVAPLHVVAPAFSADCLETLEELDGLNRELYVHEGGRSEDYVYIPALNDRPDHVRFLADLAKRHLQGWTETPRARPRAAPLQPSHHNTETRA